MERLPLSPSSFRHALAIRSSTPRNLPVKIEDNRSQMPSSRDKAKQLGSRSTQAYASSWDVPTAEGLDLHDRRAKRRAVHEEIDSGSKRPIVNTLPSPIRSPSISRPASSRSRVSSTRSSASGRSRGRGFVSRFLCKCGFLGGSGRLRRETRSPSPLASRTRTGHFEMTQSSASPSNYSYLPEDSDAKTSFNDAHLSPLAQSSKTHANQNHRPSPSSSFSFFSRKKQEPSSPSPSQIPTPVRMPDLSNVVMPRPPRVDENVRSTFGTHAHGPGYSAMGKREYVDPLLAPVRGPVSRAGVFHDAGLNTGSRNVAAQLSASSSSLGTAGGGGIPVSSTSNRLPIGSYSSSLKQGGKSAMKGGYGTLADRMPLHVTLHTGGTIEAQTRDILDEESRRLTEVAFM